MKIAYICRQSSMKQSVYEGMTVHIMEICRALRELGNDVFLVIGGSLPISGLLRIHEVMIPPLLPLAHLLRNLETIATSIRDRFRAKTLSAKENKYVGGVEGTKLDATTVWSLIALWHDIKTRVDDWEHDRYFYHQADRVIGIKQPDVLYEHYYRFSFAGVNLARRYGLPLILEMHGSYSFRREWPDRRHPLSLLMIHWSEKHLCQRANAIVVVTPFLRQYLIDLGISEEKISVIPNGADIEHFCPDETNRAVVRSKYGLNDRLVVGFVGGLRPYHGLSILINSARLVVSSFPKAHFLIVGEGPPRQALELQVREQGLDEVFTFTGNVPFKDVPAYINAMDITVAPFPKLPDFYFSAIKILEYMAVAKPVVASRYPDTESVISDHVNGILVDPGDSVQLAQAILELLEDKELRMRLGEEARRLVSEKYTWKQVALKIIKISENLRPQNKK